MKIAKYLMSLAAGTAMLASTQPAQAQDMYMGQIILVGFGYCPTQTLEANGQTLSIAQNSALFSLLGVTYGGNGQTTFALPDLRGRSAIHTGQGPGLQNYPQGAVGGTESVAIDATQMPPHAHTGRVRATTLTASSDDPTGNILADFPAGTPVYTGGTPNVDMAPNTVITDPAGGGQPVGIRNPFLTLRYCVVVEGIFPPRP
jgi:microcystin-dependent protein